MQVIPVLKPAYWQGMIYGALAHIWIGEPRSPRVVVAYGCVTSGRMAYVDQDASGWEDQEMVVREAFANLDDHEIPLRTVGSGRERVAVSAGPLAAEQVLSERHMLALHEALEADEVVVSIARRESLIACRADASPTLRRTMSKLHEEAWSSRTKPTERLFDQFVVFAKGEMVDTVLVGPEAPDHATWGRWAPE